MGPTAADGRGRRGPTINIMAVINQVSSVRSTTYAWMVVEMVFMMMLGQLGLSIGGWRAPGAGIARHRRKRPPMTDFFTPRGQTKDRISYIPLLVAGRTDIFHRWGALTSYLQFFRTIPHILGARGTVPPRSGTLRGAPTVGPRCRMLLRGVTKVLPAGTRDRT